MAHQSLARRYRPRRFADATAQDHVSETLRHAVAGDRVAHAYLFCGPRGVGKTTLARVLAMALNCADRAEDGEPCGECESCRRIWGGHTALDVIEIDAASNRGVEDARDLRERAMYAPSEAGRYKVYIVDEAHMLTRDAWNALLKILEEPPPRVIFVFATTEPHKIEQMAAPILSRCQRFDFRRIGVADIAARLAHVLAGEGAAAPEDALRLIARKADGGMRDGLSLLDQVLSLTGGEVDQESVRRVLGLVDEERYLQLLDLLREGRHGDVFGFVEGLLDEGYDLVEFYHGLVDVLRVVLRLRLTPSSDIAELRDDLRAAFLERGEAFDPGDLVRMLSLASELESTGSLRRSAQPRVLLEMLLLRLSYLDRTVELESLVRGLGGAPLSDTGGERSPAGGSEGRDARGSARSTASTAFAATSSTPTTDPPTPRAAMPDLAASGPATTGPATRAPAMTGAAMTGAAAPDPGVAASATPTAAPEALRAALETATGGVEGALQRAPRVTQDTVREDRLRELIRREPLLERAVEALDLELLD